MTPRETAEKSAAAMWAADAASKWFGMEIVEVDEGRATLRMTIAAHHANGHGICHGAVIYALADSAFAFACNSRNQASVAQSNMITYIAPARVGDVLTATAEEISVAGRSGIYDVSVADGHGTAIAEFRGHSRTVKGVLFDEAKGN